MLRKKRGLVIENAHYKGDITRATKEILHI